MDERLRFVARLLEGEKMAVVCRQFGISRVTGYKIFNRYKECGLEALNDRSRRPYRHANKLPFQVERTILAIKREHGSWGAPKIRDKLIRQLPMLKPPATSTIHAVLDRHGLGQYFTHSTGHGVGREIHESPRVAPKQRMRLPEGAVITIEPAVYIPGLGGVRIEDVVVARKDSVEVLTRTPKELMTI